MKNNNLIKILYIFSLCFIQFFTLSLEVIDEKNILENLDDQIGNIHFHDALNDTEDYFNISCFGPFKMDIYCLNDIISIDANTFEEFDPKTGQLITYAFINKSSPFKVELKDYIQNNGNLVKIFINLFINNKAKYFKKKFSRYLNETNIACKSDVLETLNFVKHHDYYILDLKLDLCLKNPLKVNGWKSPIYFTLKLTHGRTLFKQLAEFKAYIPNIGSYRLISTSHSLH